MLEKLHLSSWLIYGGLGFIVMVQKETDTLELESYCLSENKLCH